MDVITTRKDLARWRAASRPSVFVPTMGALHEGHLSLMRLANRAADERRLHPGCVVSIFVNPSQFNEQADFDRYPRDLERDIALCEQQGASLVLAPGVEEVYPPGVEIATPPLPRVAWEPKLEDAARPGHFAGVCRVLMRLFQLVQPAAAVFGEKDWQQLQVARALSDQEHLGVEIIGAPIVRDADGLALSSRNARLSAEERLRALGLHRALDAASGASTPSEAEHVMHDILRGIHAEIAYCVVRDSRTLLPANAGPYRALIACRIGTVHLLDNAPWPEGPS